MTTRNIVLIAVLAVIGMLAFLTISVAIQDGIDVLVVVSVLILAMFGFGVVGALTEKEDEE